MLEDSYDAAVVYRPCVLAALTAVQTAIEQSIASDRGYHSTDKKRSIIEFWFQQPHTYTTLKKESESPQTRKGQHSLQATVAKRPSKRMRTQDEDRTQIFADGGKHEEDVVDAFAKAVTPVGEVLRTCDSRFSEYAVTVEDDLRQLNLVFVQVNSLLGCSLPSDGGQVAQISAMRIGISDIQRQIQDKVTRFQDLLDAKYADVPVQISKHPCAHAREFIHSCIFKIGILWIGR